MNSKQKESIELMRNEGYSYSRISEALGLSENTIKSYCRRNKLGGVRQEKLTESNEFNIVCKNCGIELVKDKIGQPKKFCSDKCRREWWKENDSCINRKAYYNIVCLQCGESFKSYGNKNRKFCSHRCYINNRFGGGESND